VRPSRRGDVRKKGEEYARSLCCTGGVSHPISPLKSELKRRGMRNLQNFPLPDQRFTHPAQEEGVDILFTFMRMRRGEGNSD